MGQGAAPPEAILSIAAAPESVPLHADPTREASLLAALFDAKGPPAGEGTAFGEGSQSRFAAETRPGTPILADVVTLGARLGGVGHEADHVVSWSPRSVPCLEPCQPNDFAL